ncbi:MAG: formylglycine-generating enzyme family protein [Geitlerinemataceae cyanobacterium]
MLELSKPLPEGWRVRRKPGTGRRYREVLAEGVELVMVEIPAGEFWMGSAEGEPGAYEDEQPRHRVSLERFFLGQMAVTQAQWQAVAGYPQIETELKADPSRFKGGNRPVERVSWEEAREFCQRLSVRTGKDYRLPSEAQWEYGCRAGTETPFHFGDFLTDELANYRATEVFNGSPEGKYRKETVEVGSFAPNAWGLHEMHGNVWEWCADDWHRSYDGAPTDGNAWLNENRTKTTEEDETENSTKNKVLRGGSWNDFPRICRSAIRGNVSRADRDGYLGFRVCCVPPRALR